MFIQISTADNGDQQILEGRHLIIGTINVRISIYTTFDESKRIKIFKLQIETHISDHAIYKY